MATLADFLNSEGFIPPKKVTKQLIFMRGAPGSGKTTLARQLVSSAKKNDAKVTTCILSTDDFFSQEGKYNFVVEKLQEAHLWNQERAKKALEAGTDLVIIDNTNAEAWEMKVYAEVGKALGYSVFLQEPNTAWKRKAEECSAKSTHKVPVQAVRKFLFKYQAGLTVDRILASKVPEGLGQKESQKGA